MKDGRLDTARKEAINNMINVFTVDTVETVDHGWETRVKPEGQRWILLERYDSRKPAKIGHSKWVKILTHKTKLILEDINYA